MRKSSCLWKHRRGRFSKWPRTDIQLHGTQRLLRNASNSLTLTLSNKIFWRTCFNSCYHWKHLTTSITLWLLALRIKINTAFTFPLTTTYIHYSTSRLSPTWNWNSNMIHWDLSAHPGSWNVTRSDPLKPKAEGRLLIQHVPSSSPLLNAVWHVWLREWDREHGLSGTRQRAVLQQSRKLRPELGKTSIKYLLPPFKSISPRQIKK